MDKKWWTLLFLPLIAITHAAAAVHTASISKPFYEGKTIRLVVGYSPGGGFDTWSRLIAKHISRHIPGKPSIIVQNMPGAASLAAANWVYARQPGDGLTIVNFNGAHVVNGILELPAVKFEPEKFVWIGSPTPGFRPQVLYVRPEVANSLDQFLKSAKPVSLGATGRGSNSFQTATFLEVSGTNVRVVGGYPGTADVYAAIERKEVDGIFSSQESAETTFKRFTDERIVVPLVKFGPDNPGLRSLELPNFSDVARRLRLTPELERLGNFLIASHDLARMYAVPPGTPAEQVEILRKAFLLTLKDPSFVKDAAHIGYMASPLSASEIENLLASMIKTPQSVKELFKKLFQ